MLHSATTIQPLTTGFSFNTIVVKSWPVVEHNVSFLTSNTEAVDGSVWMFMKLKIYECVWQSIFLFSFVYQKYVMYLYINQNWRFCFVCTVFLIKPLVYLHSIKLLQKKTINCTNQSIVWSVSCTIQSGRDN